MFFKKVLIAFFIFFSTLMLFIIIIRLGNNKISFLGLSDLFSYFENGNVDFYKPISYFSNDIGGIIRDFQYFLSDIVVNNPWDAITVAVKMLGNIFKLLYIPVIAVFDLIKMLVGYISIFANFINWVISFEGYPAITY